MKTRFQDWPLRLAAFVESRRSTPFEFGVNDCCRFACDAVVATTGEDPSAELPKYSTREEAERLIAEYGDLEKLIEAHCARMGFAELPTARKAHRGDLVIFDNAGKPAVGVCIGGSAAFPGKDGLVFHPLKDCRRAWRV
jgi:hypothetical protein